MQLIEYLLWKYQPCSKQNAFNKNITVSRIGSILNHLQPIVLWLSILKFSPKRLPKGVNYMMLVFTGITILYTQNFLKDPECSTVTKISKPHIEWTWTNYMYFRQYYSMFMIVMAILSFVGLEKGHYMASMLAVFYAISFFMYDDQNVVGSMWCFMASFGPWILYGYYKKSESIDD
jgi:hypothetical protein